MSITINHGTNDISGTSLTINGAAVGGGGGVNITSAATAPASPSAGDQ